MMIQIKEWKAGPFLFSLLAFTFVISCSGVQKNVSSEKKTAIVNIQSTGIEKSNKKDKNLVLYFVQYSIDGKLIQAHQIKENFERRINVTPGKHNLFVEHAHRGMLSARALLQKEGECYTFRVTDGQTVLFEGNAVSEDKWEAIGFSDGKSFMKKCTIKECQAP